MIRSSVEIRKQEVIGARVPANVAASEDTDECETVGGGCDAEWIEYDEASAQRGADQRGHERPLISDWMKFCGPIVSSELRAIKTSCDQN